MHLRFEEQQIKNHEACPGSLQAVYHGTKMLATPGPTAEFGNTLVVNGHQHHLCPRGSSSTPAKTQIQGFGFQVAPEYR